MPIELRDTPGIAPSKSYRAALRPHRFRRRVTLALLYSFLPFCVALYFLVTDPVYFVVGAIPAMAVFGGFVYAAVWWTGRFRCPRCKRRFGSLGSRTKSFGWAHGLFDDLCANCKLPKAQD